MKISSCALALVAISALSTTFSTSAFAMDRERTVQEKGAFTALMWTPTTPDKVGACPTFVFRLDNRLQRRIHFDAADLRVYWVSNDKLQSINGFRPNDPRRTISLIDATSRLKSTGVLSRQVINICGAAPGENRVTMALRYVTHKGNVGNLRMTSTFCVRSATEDCGDSTELPDTGTGTESVPAEVVDHTRFPSSRFPIEFLQGVTENTITASDCPAPSYAIAANTSHVACVDSDAFPAGTLLAIDKSIGCPSGTTRTGGGTDFFRELCVSDDHPLGLRWHLGFLLPQNVRSTAGGADGYMPVDQSIYSQWYLSVNSRQPESAQRFERVDGSGSLQYSTRIAGSAGKLPEIQGGAWRATSDDTFVANAWGSDTTSTTVYCGYAPTIALCSTTRSELNSFTYVVEAMYLQSTAGPDTTPVYLYGTSNIVTQSMIDAGTVNATVLAQSRSLMGYTAQN